MYKLSSLNFPGELSDRRLGSMLRKSFLFQLLLLLIILPKYIPQRNSFSTTAIPKSAHFIDFQSAIVFHCKKSLQEVSQEELLHIDGIGPQRAALLNQARATLKDVRDTEQLEQQLLQIKNFGPATVAKVLQHITTTEDDQTCALLHDE